MSLPKGNAGLVRRRTSRFGMYGQNGRGENIEPQGHRWTFIRERQTSHNQNKDCRGEKEGSILSWLRSDKDGGSQEDVVRIRHRRCPQPAHVKILTNTESVDS